jgi:hypothetical protein
MNEIQTSIIASQMIANTIWRETGTLMLGSIYIGSSQVIEL